MPLDIQLINPVKDSLLGLTLDEMKIKCAWEKAAQQGSLHLHAGFPAKPLENTLLPELNALLSKAYPDLAITTDLSYFINSHRTQLLGKSLRGIKNTIAVASGKGGVGKSTVTVNIATALARAGANVGILDADIYGPSIPTMLGAGGGVQVNEQDRYIPVQAHNLHAMSIGYLTDPNKALIWRGPMLAKSLIQMLDNTEWNNLDYLFIDLPPGTGDIQLSLVQKIPLTGAIVVTTPQQVATLEAGKAIDMFERTSIDVLGIIENMSGHLCSQCDHLDPVFGKHGGALLSEKRNLTLLGQLPLATAIQESCDLGLPIALSSGKIAEAYMAAALKLSIALARKPLNYADKFSSISS